MERASKRSVKERSGKADIHDTEEQLGVEVFSQLGSPVMKVEEFSNICQVGAGEPCM